VPASSVDDKSLAYSPETALSPRRTVELAIFAAGLTALLLQVLLTRELLVSFFGNELCIGLILMDWLLLVALGTALAGRLLSRLPATWGLLLGSELALAVIVPLQIYWARGVGGRAIFPGELIDPLTMILLAAVVLAPGCLVLGAQFAWSCALITAGKSSRRTASIAVIYVLEAVGSIIGGLLFHFWLADNLQTMRIALLLAALNALVALVVSRQLARPRHRRAAQVTAGLLAVALIVMGGGSAAVRFEMLTSARHWPGYELVTSQHTRYGNVAVTRLHDQLSVFHDGLLMFTSQDYLASEELAHLVMLQHPDPRSVLIMGGGLSGVIGEVLKHNPQRVDYVELDRQAVQIIRPHLPPRLEQPLRDPRVTVIYTDALAYLHRTQTHYDVIISNVGDPVTAVLNRFYTRQAFAEAAAHLNSPGIFCAGLSYPQTHLSGPRRMLHASVLGALQQSFAQVLPLPDGRIYYLAATGPQVLTTDEATLAERLAQRKIETAYITRYFLHTVLVPFARELLADSLSRVSAPVNDDFRPITYHYFLQLWLRQFAPTAREIAPRPGHIAGAVGGVAGLCVLIALLAWRRRSRRSRRRAIALTLAITGILEMSMQLVVIFSFQVIAGSLFYQIGILMTLFMVGLAAGGHLGRYATGSRRSSAVLLAATLVGLLAATALMPVILTWLATHRALAAVVLGTCAAVFGLLGGLGYPPAVEVCAAGGDEARAGAVLYASDLAGAALGALLVSTLVIPAAGLLQTCLLLSVLSLGGLALSSVAFCTSDT